MTITVDLEKVSKMTAREYAASLGLAKLGRGKLSVDAKAAIAKAESEGVTFKPSASEVAKAEADKRRAEGRTRKPKAKTPVDTSKLVLRDGKLTTNNVTSDYDGKSLYPSADWYKATFYVGSYVCDPQGRTLFCITNEPDSEGFTHFVDKAAKKWKAKVNASWGIRDGWPTGGISVND